MISMSGWLIALHCPKLELIAVLIEPLVHVWRLKDLPTPIRGLMKDWQMDYVVRSALRALLERKLPSSMRNAQAEEKVHTSGVPPPSRSLEVTA
jgi:hypothetical protein